jgi:hypothetical protein
MSRGNALYFLTAQIAVSGEIEGESQRIRRPALIAVPVDVGRDDEFTVVVDHLVTLIVSSSRMISRLAHALKVGFPQ